MNRRNFFKGLTAAVVGVIVAPAVVAKVVSEVKVYKSPIFNDEGAFTREFHTTIIKESIGFDGGELVGNIWKLEAARNQPYNNEPFDIEGFDTIIH